MQENAIKHPGDDELADEHHDKWSALREARLRILFGLALFEGLALRSHPRLAKCGVVNAAENPRSDGGNQDRNDVGVRKIHRRPLLHPTHFADQFPFRLSHWLYRQAPIFYQR